MPENMSVSAVVVQRGSVAAADVHVADAACFAIIVAVVSVELSVATHVAVL
jgi:hypothetical protein